MSIARAIAAAYAAGEKVDDIAKRLGVNRHYPSCVAYRYGLQLRQERAFNFR